MKTKQEVGRGCAEEHNELNFKQDHSERLLRKFLENKDSGEHRYYL